MKNFQKVSLLLLFVACAAVFTSPIQARFFGKDLEKGIVVLAENDGCDEPPPEDEGGE